MFMGKREYYDPIVQQSASDNPYIAGPCVTLTEPIDIELFSTVIEELRARYPYFYGKVKIEDEDLVFEPNPLPIVVRNSWEPIHLFSKESNYHFLSFKVDGNRFAAEFSHAFTDGSGFMPYLKSLLYLYITRKTGAKLDPTGILLPGEKIPESETRNPFADFDLDSIPFPAANDISRDLIYRLPEEIVGEKNHWQSIFMQMPEATIMDYCKKNGATPNILFATLLAKAIRRLDPETNKVIRVGVAIDSKTSVGSPYNHRGFSKFARLDYHKEQENDDLVQTYKTKRAELKEEATVENTLLYIKEMKIGWEKLKPLPLQMKVDIGKKVFIEHATFVSVVVSYIKTQSFGPLDPYIEEIYGIAEPSHEDVVCELKCLNNKFFFTFIQTFADETLFKLFLEEMDTLGILYEIKRKEPLRTSGVRYDELEGLKI